MPIKSLRPPVLSSLPLALVALIGLGCGGSTPPAEAPGNEASSNPSYSASNETAESEAGSSENANTADSEAENAGPGEDSDDGSEQDTPPPKPLTTEATACRRRCAQIGLAAFEKQVGQSVSDQLWAKPRFRSSYKNHWESAGDKSNCRNLLLKVVTGADGNSIDTNSPDVACARYFGEPVNFYVAVHECEPRMNQP